MKIAFIVVRLLEESKEKGNSEIEKEILAELSKGVIIPWMQNVEKVTVLENQLRSQLEA